MTWHEDAACRTLPTRIFYPQQGSTAHVAKAVCATCPVAHQCAQEGAHEPHGVWGGRSPAERGTSLHNRGEAHRLYDVAVCAVCDTRFWTHKRSTGNAQRCVTCRTEAVAWPSPSSRPTRTPTN